MWNTSSRHARSYEYYFSSGYYDQRYPRPNPNVLSEVQRRLPEKGGRIIDFGCGSGRYTLPLAYADNKLVCFDICASARARLQENVDQTTVGDNVRILAGDDAALQAEIDEHGPADMLIALFGVMAHIPDRDVRIGLLRWFGRMVDPEAGRILVSVPNKRRRFRSKQRDSESHSDEVVYTRSHNAQELEFFYKLYDVEGFRVELEEAGLVVEDLRPESLFPESWLANSSIVRGVERLVGRWIPASLGYGLLAVCHPPRQAACLAAAQMKKTA